MENRVKFKIGEIEFEAEGTAEIIERERTIFLNTLLPAAVDAIIHTKSIQGVSYIEDNSHGTNLLADSTQEIPFAPENTDFSKTSLASFIKSKGAVSNYEFILCAVYFDEHKNSVSSFSSTTIKNLFTDAKRPAPRNLSMAISELVKKGLIMEDESNKGQTPKCYVLTADGQEMVEKMQPKTQKQKPKVTKSHRSRPREISIYSDIDLDDLNLEKYPSVKALKNFKEKMLTVLYIITNENKGQWFSTNDVLCLLTDIFGESATKDQISGVFKREKTWFKSEKQKDGSKQIKHKLLNQGIDFAKSLGK